IHLPNPWVPGRDAGPSDAVIEIEVAGEKRVEQLKDPRILFAHEAELASRAILDGRTEASSPAPNLSDSVGNARVIATWRE
ncbi:MAG: oxidoreductase, partial [Deltaproteobacteria bacterium]